MLTLIKRSLIAFLLILCLPGYGLARPTFGVLISEPDGTPNQAYAYILTVPNGTATIAASNATLSIQPSDAALTSIAGLTLTVGDLIYATAADTYNVLDAGAEGTLLMGNGAAAPSWLGAGTAGYYLIGAGAADPVWTQLYKTIYIDAGAMVPNTTNGAQSGTYEYGTNDLDLDYMAFDTTTEEYVSFKTTMPEDWDRSTVKAKFYWSSAAGSSQGDTVEWEIGAVAISNDDPIDVNAYADPEVISDVVLAGTSGDLHISGATPAITVQGTPALGDMILWKVSRNVGGTDDMAEDAWLFGCLIQFAVSNSVAAW